MVTLLFSQNTFPFLHFLPAFNIAFAPIRILKGIRSNASLITSPVKCKVWELENYKQSSVAHQERNIGK